MELAFHFREEGYSWNAFTIDMAFHSLGPAVPQWGNAFTRFLGRAVLRSLGWNMEGEIPNIPRFVGIVAPHTSNWDFVVGMATLFALGLYVHWLGKHTLFRRPFGWIWRKLGGIPVDRAESHGVVEKSVETFQSQHAFILGLSPEGTRKRIDRWKTGFYFIALNSHVPILLVAFDYGTKTVKFGPLIYPTGNLEMDMMPVRQFYSGVLGKYPEKFSIGV